VARHVTLELELPADARLESLGAFQARIGKGRAVIELGDLVSGQQVDVPLRFSFAFGELGDVRPAVFTLTDRDGVLDGAGARVAWEYADDRSNDGQPRDRGVDRLVAGIYAARARQLAVDLNRRLDYRTASEALKATAKKILGYAGSDPELRSIANGLLTEAEMFGHVMPERSRKAAWAMSANVMMSRDVQGRARRGA
jgi:hypothetical protein